jgi:hypothetical protein
MDALFINRDIQIWTQKVEQKYWKNNLSNSYQKVLLMGLI